MSKPAYKRARHNAVGKLLASLNADFLGEAKCFFGGGTRIVLELNEYRESADVDFLCSDRAGYRALRAAIKPDSLGELACAPLQLLREIRADQYGLRTIIQIDQEPIKLEFINEARIDLAATFIKPIPVPCLNRATCFAEKILANDDRGMDESVASRDVIDITFMIEAWSMAAFVQGLQIARGAYGEGVDGALVKAAQKLLDQKNYFKKCLTALAINEGTTLKSGLARIVAQDWRASGDTKA